MASFNPIPTTITEKRVIVGKAFDLYADGVTFTLPGTAIYGRCLYGRPQLK